MCVRWLLLGRADRARVSGYWCSEMMLDDEREGGRRGVVALFVRSGMMRMQPALCFPSTAAEAAAAAEDKTGAEFRQP